MTEFQPSTLVKSKPGVYSIINKTNGHQYVGSAVKISNRWNRHRKDLRKNRHHSPYLQNAWNKYGEHNFEFKILENCPKNLIIERENHYFKIQDKEYNICLVAGNSQGRKPSKEQRKAMSIGHKKLGIKPPETAYEKIRRPVRRIELLTGASKDYKSILEALRDLNKSISKASYISQVASRKPRRKTAYGFKWEYLPKHV